MVDYLKNIDVAAVEADLMQEIEEIKSKNSKNAEKHIQAVYDVIECIKQQCNL